MVIINPFFLAKLFAKVVSCLAVTAACLFSPDDIAKPVFPVDVRLEGTSVCERCWVVIHSMLDSKVHIHTAHFRNVLRSRARTSTVKRIAAIYL